MSIATATDRPKQQRRSTVSGTDSSALKGGATLIIPQTLSVCVFGVGGSGKSALTIRYVSGHFVAKYDPTIEDSYRRTVEFLGHSILLEVYDTAGQEEYAAITETYMKTCDTAIIVCAIDYRQSVVQTAQHLHKKLKALGDDRIRGPISVVLAINKVDLLPDSRVYNPSGDATWKEMIREPPVLPPTSVAEKEEEARLRSNRDALCAYAKDNHIPYMFTSASTGKNVDMLFQKAVELGVDRRSDRSNRRRTSVSVGTITNVKADETMPAVPQENSSSSNVSSPSGSPKKKKSRQDSPSSSSSQKTFGCVLL